MSGTLIDRLVVSLSLDPADFTRGQQAAVASLRTLQAQADRTDDGVGKSTASMSGGFEKMGASMGGAASALGGIASKMTGLFAIIGGGTALIETFTNSISRMGEVGRDARVIGISPQDLSGWQNAIRAVGGDPASITGDLRSSSQAMEGARDFGQATGFTNVLQSLGISQTNADGSERSTTDVYADLADKFHNMPAPEAAYWASMAGLSPDTQNLLLSQSGAQLKGTIAKDASVTKPEETAAQKLQEEWATIVADQQKFANLMTTQVAPSMEGIANSLIQFINSYQNSDLAKAVAYLQQPATTLNALQNGENSFGGKMHQFWNWAETPGSNLGTMAKHEFGKLFGDKPLGIRNNNPGNLRFVGQAGAHPDANGFAVFPTMDAGVAALKNDILAKSREGYGTMAKLITRYEGGTDPNDTGAGNPDHNNIKAYIAFLKARGIDPNAPLDTSPAGVQKLAQGIINREDGSGYGIAGGAAAATSSLPAQKAVIAAAKAGAGQVVHVAVGGVTVHAKSADAGSVVKQTGRQMGAAIKTAIGTTGLA